MTVYHRCAKLTVQPPRTRPMSAIADYSPIVQSLLAGLFTWGSTASGAATVFLYTSTRRHNLDLMMGMTAGVMLAASFWGLLDPAIETSALRENIRWIPAATGFILGWSLVQLIDRLLPALPVIDTARAIAHPSRHYLRTLLLVLAMTLHNIPEGLGLGIAFSAAHYGHSALELKDAVILALALGLHNIPEGIVVALPLYRCGLSAGKSFFMGQLSAMVDPVFAVIGAFSLGIFEQILPYGLGFAAGAMIYVVVSEVIPESHSSGNPHHANAGCAIGLLLMMALEFGLGGVG